MKSATPLIPAALARRAPGAREGLIFLSLCGLSIALFLVTLALFHSFESRREGEAQRLIDLGKTEMESAHPDQAVTALRGALTYRDDLPTEILLAQALAAAGRTSEATNYFLGLRDSRPGDGFLNLQLARLYRQEHLPSLAIESYGASIFGDWQGDGALRRREVRLELSAYLAQQGQTAAARNELLTAAGNAPDTIAYALLFGGRFLAIGDTADALHSYKRALDMDPHDYDGLANAGRASYVLGKYADAYSLLTAALNATPTQRSTHPLQKGSSQNKNLSALDPARERQQIKDLAANAHRLIELDFSRDLPALERTEHLLAASRIAQARLTGCLAPFTNSLAGKEPTSALNSQGGHLQALNSLHARWQAAAPHLNTRTLDRDASAEDVIGQLVIDTETGTARYCGAAQGDDALLLKLATDSQTQP